jgi:hypothetical protein
LIQKKACEIEDREFIIWLDSDHVISHNNDGSILIEWRCCNRKIKVSIISDTPSF